MDHLPDDLIQYFQSVQNGLMDLLPPARVQNRGLLSLVFDTLLKEDRFTDYDLKHLRTLQQVADWVSIPPFATAKALIQCESHLFKSSPELPKKQVHYCLEYLFYLLSRHGVIREDLSKVRIWFSTWRALERFKFLEQPLVMDFVGWMREENFSPQSIYERILELYKFRTWLESAGIENIPQIGAYQLQIYLMNRAPGYVPETRQKILGTVKTFLHFYRERVDGGYVLPEISIQKPVHLVSGESVNSQAIAQLWAELEQGQVTAQPALMLVFVLGHGLPLKALPLLRLVDVSGKVAYTEQRPCRLGEQERVIQVSLEEPWLAVYWEQILNERDLAYPYLFSSPRAVKRQQPISSEYCQRLIQEILKERLGLNTTVNRLERGSLRALAQRTSLSDFMNRTEQVPLARRTKLMVWLSVNSIRNSNLGVVD